MKTRTNRLTPNADQASVKLAQRVAKTLQERELSQTEAARIMRDAPSQLSLVTTGKLRGISTERLMSMLARLGHDVHIVVRERRAAPNGARTRGKIAYQFERAG